MTAKKLWIWLGATVAASFLVLIFYGTEIYRTAPDFPTKIVTTDGQVLYEGQDIKDVHGRTDRGQYLGAWCLYRT